MFLIASVLVLAVTVYVYGFLRVGTLDPIPLPIIGLLLVSILLAAAQIRRAGRRWVKLLSVFPILLSATFLYGVLFFYSYGEERPVGPTVGELFPVQTLTRVTDGQPVQVGRSRAEGRLQLVLLFRGFW